MGDSQSRWRLDRPFPWLLFAGRGTDSRRHEAVRHAGSLLCIAACALVAGGSVAHADPTPTTIASGVTIGPVSVGGMTAWQAKVAVKQTYAAPLVVRVKHHTFPVKPAHFHTSVPVDAAVQTALTAAADTAVPLKPTFSKWHVQKWVRNLAAKTYRAPVPGSIAIHNGRPRLFHPHPGHRLQLVATQVLIRDELLAGTRGTIVAPLHVLKAPGVKNEAIIVVHRSLNRLVLFRGTHWVRAFPVATGQAIYPTPLGRFSIIVKEKNPWWYPPTQDAWAAGLKPVPPGPGNPLGTRWMGLSTPGVGIHGTSEPWSIGHSESHGCIRMQVPDAEWLYKRVRVGTPVFIVPN
jgi:lipoprotein-anchoring transpeptidase ErfK/SrfK